MDAVVQRTTATRAAVRFHCGRRRAAHALAGRGRATRPRSCRHSRRCRALYIADGHHRAASAARARQHLRGGGGVWRVGHVPRGRISGRSDVGVALQPSCEGSGRSHTPDTFVAALRQSVAVAKGGPATPTRKGEVSMFLGGAWYTIETRHPSSGNRRRGRARREPPAGPGADAAARDRRRSHRQANRLRRGAPAGPASPRGSWYRPVRPRWPFPCIPSASPT